MNRVGVELISELLKTIAEYASHEFVWAGSTRQPVDSGSQKEKGPPCHCQKQAERAEVLLCQIYEDNILDKLPDSRYGTLDAQYGKEQAELTEEMSSLEARPYRL